MPFSLSLLTCWLRSDLNSRKLLATPSGVSSTRAGVSDTPTFGDGAPDLDGVGVLKVRNSGVLPGVEKGVVIVV